MFIHVGDMQSMKTYQSLQPVKLYKLLSYTNKKITPSLELR